MRAVHVGDIPNHPRCAEGYGRMGLYIQNGGIRLDQKYKSGGNFYGMGAYTRANAEVCLLGVTPGFKAKALVKSHTVHQVIESPIQAHSIKPDEVRQRIVELLGDVPRIELFARQHATGWDAWGDELE